MAYIQENGRTIYDPERGWRVKRPWGGAEVTEAEIEAVPVALRADKIGASNFDFEKNGEFYCGVQAAVRSDYDEFRKSYFFSRNELQRVWQEGIVEDEITSMVAPEIKNFEDFWLLIREGVIALVKAIYSDRENAYTFEAVLSE